MIRVLLVASYASKMEGTRGCEMVAIRVLTKILLISEYLTSLIDSLLNFYDSD